MDYSAIKDNHSHGTVGGFLKQVISNNSVAKKANLKIKEVD